MMIMIIIMIIEIIMIALKGAIPDFLHSPHCAANCLHTYAQVTTWCEGTAQLLSIDRVEIAFMLSLFC